MGHKVQLTNSSVCDIDKKAFVAYYNEKGIIPVSQDISDPDFVFKRESL